MAIECCFCLIFVVAPVLGIVVVYGGFNIHNAYTFYFGGKFLNEEEWNRVMVPIYLFIIAGILSIIIPIPLVWGLIKRNSRVLILVGKTFLKILLLNLCKSN
ncbi:hypothetical protein Ocin01_19994 [Orchesella cincta]|uniref:Uncharacterized protein n=1 Tax=Orchesella cincta TaxID=48709 RepID=A0A1D2M138_ORCCI|nr:hypothetical protein Ocin01_19994 [Orchesella cincta]